VLAAGTARGVDAHTQVTWIDLDVGRARGAPPCRAHGFEATWVPVAFGAMQYRHLGRTGMMVSAISYGNWVTHGGQVGESDAVACVRAALDAGVTTFDTADVYHQGAAESVLGKALQGVRRDSIEIFTKVYWPTGPNPNNRGLSRKHILESCDASLERLGTDHLDLLQAHRFDVEAPLAETLRAFDDLIRAGKVHYVGVSEWTAAQIAEAVELAAAMGLDGIVSNQPQYSMLWRVPEAEVMPTCRAHGIGQVVWSPLAQGVLTGKYAPGQPPPSGSRATEEGAKHFISWLLRDEVLAPVQRFCELAREAGLTPAHVALAWVLRNDNVSSAIVGASRPEQVTENVAAADVTLDDDLVAAIDAVLAPAVLRDPSMTASPSRRP
jgi:aryl-alcohol dehydrogenase-like predicted oxidoreductase